MMSADGAKTWFIPDGYLPTPVTDDPAWKSHEAICILNVTEDDAEILLNFYFANEDPIENVKIVVPAKRCYHVRLDDPTQLGGYQVPFDTPYGARIIATVPVVVQYSRMYNTPHNISLMTTMAYPS